MKTIGMVCSCVHGSMVGFSCKGLIDIADATVYGHTSKNLNDYSLEADHSSDLALKVQ